MVFQTLGRYVGKEFLKLFLLCLAAFILIYLLADFIDRSSQFLKYNPGLRWVVMYFVYKIPLIIFQMVPVAVLLATLLNLTILSVNSEIVAIKAGGISVVRVCVPMIILSSLLSFGSFAINEYVVPYTNMKMEWVYIVKIKHQPWALRFKREDVWYKSSNAIYNVDTYHPDKNRIEGVSVYWLNDQFRLVGRTDAPKVQYKDGEWHFLNGVNRTFKDNILVSEEFFDDKVFPLPEKPDDLKIMEQQSDQMSLKELYDYVKKIQHEGYDATKYLVDLQGKISFPLISIIMSILGIPFAVRTGRSGGVATGIGMAVVIGVGYWILMGLGLSLGRAAILPPIIAAWGVHVVFLVIGTIGLFKVKQ